MFSIQKFSIMKYMEVGNGNFTNTSCTRFTPQTDHHFQTQRKLCVKFNIDGKAGMKSVAL